MAPRRTTPAAAASPYSWPVCARYAFPSSKYSVEKRPERSPIAAVRMGVETAVDEINEAGGVLGQKLRVIAYDDQGEPSRAVIPRRMSFG